MSQDLKQSTSIKVRLGPAMAVDGVTPVTTLSIAGADQAEILKANGAATVAMTGTLAAVTGCDGWYDYTVAVGDVDTLGTIDIVIQDTSLNLPIFRSFMVMSSEAWDTLYGTTIVTLRDVGVVFKEDPDSVTDQTTFVMPTNFVTANLYQYQQIEVYQKSTDESFTTYIVSLSAAADTIVTNAGPPFTMATGATTDITLRVRANQSAKAAITNFDPLTATEFNTADALTRGKLHLLARKDSGTSEYGAALTDMNTDEGSGAGLYDPTLNSLEAIADRVPLALSAGGYMKGATLTVNGRVVTGTGVPTTDPWLGGAAE